MIELRSKQIPCCFKKFYEFMKKIIVRQICLAILLYFSCLQFPSEASAQNVRVTIKMENTAMENVMTEIERQTRYLFGSDKDVDLSVKVTVDVDNEPLSTALDQMVRGTGISYDIKDSYILLSKTAARSDKLKLVRGKVTDQDGDPLVGAMVYSKTDMTRSSVTDLDGNFSLEVPSDDVIAVSLLGFKDMEIPASSATANMSIPMQQDISTLDEVVVVGYGVQKKVNVTGAVSQIKADEMQDRPVLKMTQALQGQVPNLNISFSSGQPGKSSTIDIRGTGSINGGEPLILIDGIPGSLDNINVNDVESISVLKDASASAVYGARAAFGVILVTTKSAEDGTVNVDYQGSFGVSTHAVCTDFVTDAWTNSRINDQAFFNSKGTHLFKYSDEQWNELYIRRNDKVENPERPWVVVTNVNGKDRYNYYGNFDWFNYLYKRFRPKTSHSLSVSGTQKKVKYLISGNYSNEQGIFRIAPDMYNQYGMMVKVGADITKWLTISNTTRFYKTSYKWTGFNQSYTPDNDFPVGSNDAQFYTAYYHYHPQYVPVNPDGTLTGNSDMSNYTMGFGLHAIQLYGKSKGEQSESELYTTFEAQFKLLEGWTVTANYTYRNTDTRRWYRSVAVPYSLYPGESVTWNWDPLNRDQLTDWSRNRDYNIYNIFSTYDNTFGRHHVGAMVGFNQEDYYYKNVTIAPKNIASETLNDIGLAVGDSPQWYGGQSEYALRGAFVRLNYDFAGKYLVEFSGRYDGSSRFPKNSRFAFFPSFSVGYRISEEKFFEPAKRWIDNLKIRYSYGTLGNQNVANYSYISTMSINDSSWLDSNGDRIKQTSTPAPVAGDLTWETVTTNNIGLDLDMFKNRFNFTFDVYSRATTGMLTQGPALPNVFGATEPKENAADLVTRGFELAIGWRDSFNLAGSPFNYSVKAVLSDSQTWITRFNNPTKLLDQYYEGQKLGEIWGYTIDGRFATDAEAAEYTSTVNMTQVASREIPGYYAGDSRWVDLDGDNVVNSGAGTVDDHGDLSIIGNSSTRFPFGLTLTLGWYGFDIYAFFQGIGHKNWVPGAEATMFWGPYSRPYVSFLPSDFEDKIWSAENPDAYFPRLRGYAAGSELDKPNTQYIQNVAYCKLRNLTIGYTLPRKVLDKIHMKKIRVYLSGENLFTWSPLETKYMDPEETLSGDGRTYPFSRTFSVGVEFSF